MAGRGSGSAGHRDPSLVHVVDEDCAGEVVDLGGARGESGRVDVAREARVSREPDLDLVQRDALGVVAFVDIDEQLPAVRPGKIATAIDDRDGARRDGLRPATRLRFELCNVATAGRLRTRVEALLRWASWRRRNGSNRPVPEAWLLAELPMYSTVAFPRSAVADVPLSATVMSNVPGPSEMSASTAVAAPPSNTRIPTTSASHCWRGRVALVRNVMISLLA